jgi:hypothetical protein
MIEHDRKQQRLSDTVTNQNNGRVLTAQDSEVNRRQAVTHWQIA